MQENAIENEQLIIASMHSEIDSDSVVRCAKTKQKKKYAERKMKKNRTRDPIQSDGMEDGSVYKYISWWIDELMICWFLTDGHWAWCESEIVTVK